MAGRWWWIGGAALLAIALVPGFARLDTDNSPEVFFLHGSPRVESYRQLRAVFGSGEALRVVVRGEGLWTAEGLAWLGRTEERVEALPGVEGASGLASLTQRGLAAWPPPDPEAFRRQALADPLARGLGLIDAEAEVTTLLVPIVARRRSQGELLAALEELLSSPPPGVAAGLAGVPVLDQALDGSTQEISGRFFPLLVLFSVALLAGIFRDLRSLAAPLALVAIGELAVLGPMGYLGVRLNLVLAVLPPLLFVIGLATAVHLLLAFRRHTLCGLAPEEAVVETYRDKGWAVLWTGVTTLVGFASLALSPLGPVRALGLWTGLGVGAMTLAAFTLYPALLVAWVGGRPRSRSGRLEGAAGGWGRVWAEGAARRRWLLLAAAGLAAAVAVLGLPRLREESNALTYLPATHPARAGIEALERQGVGSAVVELVLTLPAGGAPAGFRQPAARERLLDLTRRLSAQPDVYGAVGPGEVLEAAEGQLAALPLAPLAAAEAGIADALAPFLSADRRVARILLFSPVVGFERLDPVEAAARAAAGDLFPEAGAEVTGQYPLLLAAQRQLLRTLGWSLSVTLLCVAAIFRLLLGSTRLTLLALVPNLWPVLGVLGGMGWLGTPLDTATVMVASVLLGLAVDDTIHTLGHFRELAPRLGRLEAVASTLEVTAPAYLLTGLILIAGFGVCALSSFAPTARFGLLSAAGIALAVLGNLFLLPALLGATPAAVVARLGKAREQGTGAGR